MKHPKVLFLQLSKEIHTVLETKGWSRSYLAQKSGAHPGQICKILNGDFKRSSMRVERICKALGIAIEPFLVSKSSQNDRELDKKFSDFVKSNPVRKRAVLSMLRAFEQIARSTKPSRKVD